MGIGAVVIVRMMKGWVVLALTLPAVSTLLEGDTGCHPKGIALVPVTGRSCGGSLMDLHRSYNQGECFINERVGEGARLYRKAGIDHRSAKFPECSPRKITMLERATQDDPKQFF